MPLAFGPRRSLWHIKWLNWRQYSTLCRPLFLPCWQSCLFNNKGETSFSQSEHGRDASVVLLPLDCPFSQTHPWQVEHSGWHFSKAHSTLYEEWGIYSRWSRQCGCCGLPPWWTFCSLFQLHAPSLCQQFWILQLGQWLLFKILPILGWVLWNARTEQAWMILVSPSWPS